MSAQTVQEHEHATTITVEIPKKKRLGLGLLDRVKALRAKPRVIKAVVPAYKCCICRHIALVWMVQCPICNEINSWNEIDRDAAIRSGELSLEGRETPPAEGDEDESDESGNWENGEGDENKKPLLVAIGDVDATEPDRFPSGDDGLDFVLGGGLVPGSIVAIFGPPGVGKSSILTKVGCAVANNVPVIYAAGEESDKRVARRVRRLKLFKKYPNARHNLTVMENAHDTDVLCGLIIDESPLLTIVDSFGSLESERASSTGRPGGPAQVAYAAKMLADVARTTGRSIIAIGHETKDGSMAGPSIARHEVDTLLAMEHVEVDEDGNPGERAEKQTGWVRLRADGKNRDGDTSATAIYRMTDMGLVGVDDLHGYLDEKEQDELEREREHEREREKEKRSNEAASGAGTRRRARKVDGDPGPRSAPKKAQASRVERKVSPKESVDLGSVRSRRKRARSGERACRP